tara:strand:+ start:670 stop:879 length:210 start_codon:yes stop_codon:yes gene_type:complete
VKYQNKDGIELSYTGNDAHQVLVREVISEAVRLCSEYNWHDKTSMRFALENTKNFLKENFDIVKGKENV